MNQIKKFHKQNKIQKEVGWFIELFKPNKNKISDLNRKGIITYRPALNKIRLTVGIFLVGGCIITPMTNWLIPFAVKWVVK